MRTILISSELNIVSSLIKSLNRKMSSVGRSGNRIGLKVIHQGKIKCFLNIYYLYGRVVSKCQK